MSGIFDIRIDAEVAMTFREGSAGLVVGATLLGLALFAWHAVRIGGAGGIAVGVLSAFALITVLSIIGHIVLAIAHRPEAEDERDRAIDLRSTRNAYIVLCVLMWVGPVFAIGSGNAFLAALSFFGAFLLSEFVRVASRLFYYRIGFAL
jgi:hypothetical protein